MKKQKIDETEAKHVLEDAGKQSPIIYHPLHICIYVFYIILCFYVFMFSPPSFLRSRGGADTRISKSSQRRFCAVEAAGGSEGVASVRGDSAAIAGRARVGPGNRVCMVYGPSR